MKKIILLLALFAFSNIAYAMEPIDSDMVKSAQEYGVMNVSKTAVEMEKDWIFYEDGKRNKKIGSEKIIIYTPFLITALDAQNKTKSGELVDFRYGLALAKNYEGSLVIGLVLNSEKKLNPSEINIEVSQDDKKIKPYGFVLDSARKVYKIKDKKMDYDDALEYAAKIRKNENKKPFLTKEVEIMSLDGKTNLEKDEPKNALLDIKETNSIAKGDADASVNAKNSKNDEKDELSKEKMNLKTFVALLKKKENKREVILRIKNFTWQSDYLIYLDLDQFEENEKISLDIKDSYSGKREFEFSLADIK